MFDNIGGKIKGLAMFLCWFGIAAAVISGLVLIISGIANNNIMSPVIGGGVIVIGGISSWIGTWILYGFGELVDRATRIDRRLAKMDRENKE